MKARDKSELVFLKKLGKHIAALRKERMLTQKQLGDLCDMEKQNIMRIEAGNTNPTTITLLKLSEALDIDLADLFPPKTNITS